MAEGKQIILEPQARAGASIEDVSHEELLLSRESGI